MDRASLVETVRARLRLCRSGLRLDRSKCACDPDQLAQINLELVSGDAGRDCLRDFMKLFGDGEKQQLLDTFGIPISECLTPVIRTVCDTWRRLVLPYQCLPWQFFRILNMGPEEGLPFIEHQLQKTHQCSLCMDVFFTHAAWLHQGCVFGQSFVSNSAIFRSSGLGDLIQFD